MAGGKGPRQKGDRFEREVVAFLQERGIAAERIPLSGSSPFGSFSGYDLNVPLMGQDLQAECKHSGGGFKTLYKWLAHGSNDFLIIRADRSAPLAVVPLELLANLATGYAAPHQKAKKSKQMIPGFYQDEATGGLMLDGKPLRKKAKTKISQERKVNVRKSNGKAAHRSRES